MCTEGISQGNLSLHNARSPKLPCCTNSVWQVLSQGNGWSGRYMAKPHQGEGTSDQTKAKLSTNSQDEEKRDRACSCMANCMHITIILISSSREEILIHAASRR